MPIKVQASGQQKAAITIYGVLGSGFFEEGTTADQVRRDLQAMGDISDIDVFVNSPGGNVWEGLAIGNILAAHPAQVHAHVEGLAASAASIVTSACDLVTMGKGSMIMIHSPWALMAGNAEELRKHADLLDQIESGMLDIYEARTGKPRAELTELLKAETWFTAAEAVEAGLADDVLESKPRAQVAAASWAPVMACFKNTPEGFSPPQAPAASPQSAPAGAVIKEPVMPTQAPASVQTTDITAAVNAERQRVADITALCNKFNMAADFSAKAIQEGWDIAGVNAAILEEMHKSTQGGTIGHAEITEDEHDKMRENAALALVARAGCGKVATDNPFRGMTIENVAREVLEFNGVRTRGMNREAVIKAAITHSTSDFPNIFENALHKTMLNAFELQKPAWPRFCKVSSLSDFRAHLRYRTGSISDLSTVLENGEYKELSFGDASRESITAVTKGGIFNVSREMLINDDMGVFSNIAAGLGQAAARTLDKDVFNLFTLNTNTGPTMGDGVVLFHTSHGNLITSGGAAPNTTSVEAVRQKMAVQTDPSGNDYLDIRPTIWLGPVSLGASARATNAAEYDDEATKNQRRPNVTRGLFSDIIDTPRLAATVWYALADPAIAPVFEVGFVNGVQVPQLAMEEAFRSNGMSWRVNYDYAVGAVGYQGIVKNPGQ